MSQQQRTRLQVPTFRCPGSLFLASELFFLSFFFPRFRKCKRCISEAWLFWPPSLASEGADRTQESPHLCSPLSHRGRFKQTSKQTKKTAKHFCEIWMEILKNVKQNAGRGLTWYESTSSGCIPSKGFDMDAFKCRQNIQREPQQQDVGGDFRVSCQLTQVAIIPGGQLETSTRSRYQHEHLKRLLS